MAPKIEPFQLPEVEVDAFAAFLESLKSDFEEEFQLLEQHTTAFDSAIHRCDYAIENGGTDWDALQYLADGLIAYNARENEDMGRLCDEVRRLAYHQARDSILFEAKEIASIQDYTGFAIFEEDSRRGEGDFHVLQRFRSFVDGFELYGEVNDDTDYDDEYDPEPEDYVVDDVECELEGDRDES